MLDHLSPGRAAFGPGIGVLEHELRRGMRTSYNFWLDNGLALMSTPETVIRQLKEQHQRPGDDIFCANHRMSTMPPDQSLQSLQLFGKEVIPAFP